LRGHPETLLESELFGYEKGAFTDARAQKRGLFELADRGTLFLDEIGEIPLTLQAKLLRVLEEQSFRRLGGLKDILVDLRFVAATNKNLREAVKEGAFRQDLYFRSERDPDRDSAVARTAGDIPRWWSSSSSITTGSSSGGSRGSRGKRWSCCWRTTGRGMCGNCGTRWSGR